ncbi:hypothetical protein SmJEL517_g00062 [Synchytrium microbalum]|uniref:Uncharacterized protein n=1 Tax=Synchytrium microbalum TaxID=1806994 RepID=A0A507CJU6_9FUNG|nr:uncharacterized protein SmJEL517_g00062 [Synchytrium microbalum]TPX38053.1 hypothetical protein SmJEL517_g00062 [Synchytrium microbalum]
MSYEDETDLLEAACNDMVSGQLIRADLLSLFEAMTAIQIMDPKMDMGLDIPSAEERGKLDEDSMQRKELSLQDVLSIIDELYAQEMSWLSGTALPLSLFTCVYLHKPFLIPNETLRVYLMALLKSVAQMRNLISLTRITNEEDLTYDTFGFDIFEDSPDLEVVSSLQKLEDDLQNHIRESKQTESGEHDVIYLEALQSRIRHRCNIMANEYAQKEATTHKEEFDAFDHEINRSLFQQAPPRPIAPPSRADAVNNLMAVLQQCQVIAHLHGLLETVKSDSAGTLQNALQYVTCMRPQPNVLPRSFAKYLFCAEESFRPLVMIRESVISSSKPLSFEPSATPAEADVISRYMNLCCQIYEETLQCSLKNTSRMRRKLAHLIPEWERTQAESELLDVELHKLRGVAVDDEGGTGISPSEPYHLSSWVFERKLDVMIMYLSLGFQLELYRHRELIYIFWHLYYFYDTLTHHLDRTKKVAELLSVPAITSKKEKKGPKPKPKLPDRHASRVRTRTLAFAKQNLFKAYFEIALAMMKHQKMKVDKEIYNDVVYFTRRFEVFSQLGSPVPLQYSQFSSLTSRDDISPFDLLSGASSVLMLVSRIVEQLSQSTAKTTADGSSLPESLSDSYLEAKELQKIMAVVKTTTSSLEQLTRTLDSIPQSSRNFPCEFKLDSHPLLPTLHLTLVVNEQKIASDLNCT